jgi:hypothetical protein
MNALVLVFAFLSEMPHIPGIPGCRILLNAPDSQLKEPLRI